MLARLLGAGVWVNPSQRCTRIFQSVCQKNTCSLSLSSSIFAGSNPAVRCKTYRQWIGFVLRDAKKNGTRNRVRERFYSDIRYHSAKREVLRYVSQSNAKASLAWEWISCYPNQCQKISFRTVQEALKFSAAAFAWMIAESNEFMIGVIIYCFSSFQQKEINFYQSL